MNISLAPCLRLVWLLALAVTAVPFAPAQTQPPPNVTVDFTVMALVPGGVTDLFYKPNGGAMQALNAAAYVRSTSMKYVGPSTMVFYRAVVKDGVKTPVEAGKVVLPAAGGQVLLLIAGTAPDYSLGAVADNPTSFPPGNARLYNATPFNVSVLCNETDKVPLKPFAAQTVLNKEGVLGVAISYQGPDDQWHSSGNNAFRIAKDERVSIFLLTSNTEHDLFGHTVQMFLLSDKKGSVNNSAPPKPNAPKVRPPAGAGG